MKLADVDVLKLVPEFMRKDEAVLGLAAAVNKLIKEPCQINRTFLFWYYYHLVALFGIFFTEFHYQAIMCINRNLHIVQTSVTRNDRYTFNLKVHFKSH